MGKVASRAAPGCRACRDRGAAPKAAGHPRHREDAHPQPVDV